MGHTVVARAGAASTWAAEDGHESALATLQSLHPAKVLRTFRKFGELARLGSTNLASLTSYARRREAEHSELLGRLKDAEAVLRQGPGLLRTARKEVESKVVRFVLETRGHESMLVPDERTLARMKCGQSTLSLCGWCEYRASGLYRGDAMLYGDCELLGAAGEPFDREVRCNTPCTVASWNEQRFAEAVQAVQRRIDEVKAQRQQVRELIRGLRELAGRASVLPLLPPWRGETAFVTGQRTMVYTVALERAKECLVPGTTPWVAGRVVSAAGSVRVKTCVAVTTQGVEGGRLVTAGVHMPYVLSAEEFWELRSRALSAAPEDKAFMASWLAACSEDSRLFDSEQFLKDLRRGAVTRREPGREEAPVSDDRLGPEAGT